MKKQKREKRKGPKDFDYFKVIDITTIGSDNDPCFGKLYDLSEDTCRMCGDNARCAMVMAQGQNLDKSKQEKKNRFKDKEVAENDIIKEYIIKEKSKGLKRFEVINKTKKKFGIKNKKMYREIYKSF